MKQFSVRHETLISGSIGFVGGGIRFQREPARRLDKNAGEGWVNDGFSPGALDPRVKPAERADSLFLSWLFGTFLPRKKYRISPI